MWRGLTVAIVGLTLVCLAFYLARPLIDRNYGGVSCGFRWMFWFIPLWLLLALPAADAAAPSRWLRAVCLALLAASVFSSSWSALRPWAHPWLYDYWQRLGWLTTDGVVSGRRPHRLFNPWDEGFGRLPEPFQRRLVGEQEHLLMEPDAVLSSPVDQLPLFQIADGIVARQHGSEAVRIFQEPPLLLRTSEQVGAVAMNDAPASVTTPPASSFLQGDGAEAF